MAAHFVMHVGANKTGSSAIQRFLRDNSKALKAQGMLVPDRELGFSERITGEHVFAFQDLFSRADRAGLESQMQSLSRADSQTVLFSAENLSNGGNFQFFKKILAGIETKVILYIRRQDELLTSSWQQWNSKHETDFHAWLILGLQQIGHWQRCIEGWESAVGTGNVLVRIFQKSDLVQGDVVDDFISVLGLQDQAQSFKRSTEVINPSYSDVITPIVSGSRFIFPQPHDNEFYNMVGALTGDHYTTQKRVSLLSREQRNKIIEFYRLQNETVCRRYFPNRSRLFDSVDHSKYDYLTSEELTRRQLEFLASIVYAMYKRSK